MEARKITIVETKNQRKSVIMSEASTLAELKADLRENGIDYDGMTFFEGISKVELKNDAAILPHDVPYKGTTTNELVFMLTNTNKKIKSGAMTRLEAYAEIKANNLQEECLKRFGKNFTMCKTTDLISLLESRVGKKEETPVNGETYAPEAEVTEMVDTKARAAISKLVEVLYENDTLCDFEKDEITNILESEVDAATSENCKPLNTSPYSDAEIDSLFEGMDI